MHTQEDFNRFALKVAPEGSLQGFQIPYIENLIKIEPCTLWGKFLLKEREEYAFSGPQARACMRRGRSAGTTTWVMGAQRDLLQPAATGFPRLTDGAGLAGSPFP